jgi:hypothetical protein
VSDAERQAYRSPAVHNLDLRLQGAACVVARVAHWRALRAIRTDICERCVANGIDFSSNDLGLAHPAAEAPRSTPSGFTVRRQVAAPARWRDIAAIGAKFAFKHTQTGPLFLERIPYQPRLTRFLNAATSFFRTSAITRASLTASGCRPRPVLCFLTTV